VPAQPVRTSPPPPPQPRRGEIWFVPFPSDPPGKNNRPVIVISPDARNQHAKADTVLVVPFSTTVRSSPTHITMQPGETGLPSVCDVQAESITTIRKEILVSPKHPTRRLSETRIREVAHCVVKALGFVPADLVEN
jgi:mRNA-degrading endonuclease toxin of MazEF toxin-antitoxin module